MIETGGNDGRVHVYLRRHVFVGEEYVGWYDAGRRTVVLRAEHAGVRRRVAAFFKGRLGICPKFR